MSWPVRIARALIRNDAGLAAVLGNRVYPRGGVPDNAARPYAVLGLDSYERDVDLEGTEDDRTSDVRVTLVGDTDTQVTGCLARFEGGHLDGLAGTFSGYQVFDTGVLDDSVTDVTDEPIDLDDGEGYVASLVLQVRHPKP